MLQGERAILAGRAHDAFGWGTMPLVRGPVRAGTHAKAPGKKNRGRMAPEQQRQEENGDAAALPHTYRNNRQRNFRRVRRRVRKFFELLHRPRLAALPVASLAVWTGLRGRPWADLREHFRRAKRKRAGVAAVPFVVSLFSSALFFGVRAGQA